MLANLWVRLLIGLWIDLGESLRNVRSGCVGLWLPVLATKLATQLLHSLT